MKDTQPPEMKATLTKKAKKLFLEWREYKLELKIEDQEIDLIKLDQWLTELFKGEFEKVQQRNQLSGKQKLILPK